jgi:hypothetical protein
MKQLPGFDASLLYLETGSQFGHVSSLTIYAKPEDDADQTRFAAWRTFVTWRAHSSPTSPTLRAGSATAESTNGGPRERRSVRGDQAVGPLG